MVTHRKLIMGSSIRVLCLCSGICLAAWVPVCAQEKSSTAEEAVRKERLEFMKRQAAEYDVTLKAESPHKLTLHEDPLLRFSNPVGGVPDGILVMWKDGARPAIFAQVFQVKDGAWIHECQSLAAAGLTMERKGQIKWKPEKAADQFRSIEGAPPIADSPTKRLVQMKALAGTFAATDDFKISPSDKEATRNTLRLLPTPVYRYQDPELGVDDAAVFAFVHGTDPEVFLVLEHRIGERTKDGWFYCLAPMTCWGVNVSRKGTEVWSVPERFGSSTVKDPYFVWGYGP